MKIFLLFLVFLLPTESILGQPTVTGNIRDAESGEYLVGATVEIKDDLAGTITNIDGNFELTLNKVPAVLIFRFIGFQSVEQEIRSDGPFQVDISLQPLRLELEAVTVTGENPAIAIMRKVIEKKLLQREKLQSWKSEAYTRFVASNDTGIVAISESMSNAFWSKDDGLKEIAQGQRKTDNMNFTAMMPAALVMQNMYDDDIEIAGFTFPGITHPKALDLYRFSLEGRRYRDDKIVYDLAFEPKNNLNPGFNGTLSVLDEDYGLLKVDLLPNKAFFFPPPIQSFDIAYSQQFNNFGGEFFLPIDFKSSGSIKVGIPGLSVPTIRFEQLSSMTNYATSIVIPKEVKESKQIIIVDSAAVKSNQAFADRDIVPLSSRELLAYESIDSTMSLADAYKPTGFLSRFITSSSDSNSVGIGPNQSGGPSKWSLSPALGFNRAQGYSIGASANIQPSRFLGAFGTVTYDSGPEEVAWEAGLSGNLPGTRRWSWSVNYFDDYGVIGRHERYRKEISSVMALAFGHDYHDYLKKDGWGASLDWNLPKVPGHIWAEFTNENIQPADLNHFGSPILVNRYFYGSDLLEGNEQQRVRVGYESSELFEVAGNRRVAVTIESGSGNKNSLGDFSYSLVEGEIDWRIPTLLRRRFLPMSLDISIRGTYGTDETPFNRLSTIDSRMGVLAPTATLRTGRNKPLYARRTVGLFVEHNFRTVPFEILGLDYFVKNGTSLQAYFGAVRGYDPSYGDSFSCQIFDCEDFLLTSEFDQSEAGMSLSSLFGLPVRFDLTWRLDDNFNLFEPSDEEAEFLFPAERKRFYFTIGFARLF